MIGQPKIQHLVGDEHDPVTSCFLAQQFEKSSPGRDHPDAKRHRIDENAGKFVSVLGDQLAARFRPVPRQHDHVGGDARRSSRLDDRSGRIYLAPLVGSRTFADVGVIVDAVIGAFELRNLVTGGERTRGFHGEHHGLAT